MAGAEKGNRDVKNADIVQLFRAAIVDILERLPQETDTGQNGSGVVSDRDHCADRFEGAGVGVRNNGNVCGRSAASSDRNDMARSLWRRRYQADGGGRNVFRGEAGHNSPHFGFWFRRTLWVCLSFAEKEGAKRQVCVWPVFVPWHCWGVLFWRGVVERLFVMTILTFLIGKKEAAVPLFFVKSVEILCFWEKSFTKQGYH